MLKNSWRHSLHLGEGADKFLARSTSRYSKSQSIVSLERRVYLLLKTAENKNLKSTVFRERLIISIQYIYK